MKGFFKISKYAGMREDLVQAGGGNSSYKISENEMVIKASGYQLADVNENHGFAIINPKIIRDGFFYENALECMTEIDGNELLHRAHVSGDRPSIETFIHAVSGKYTLHTHPTVVNALTCRGNGMEMLCKMFPKSIAVPYATPGIKLATVYFKALTQMSESKCHNIVFLQNHGLVVSDDNAEGVIQKTEEIVKKIEDFLGVDMSAYHSATALMDYFPDKVVWKVNDINIIEAYCQLRKLWRHMFCPDCIVFLGKKVLELSEHLEWDEINSFKLTYGDPVIVYYRKNLYIIADSVRKAQEIQSVMSFSAQVMMINKGIEYNELSEEEQNYLLNWDAEKYRKTKE